jgi:Family of unknown function (DUF6312)
MDSLVRRVTVIQRGGDKGSRQAATVYKKSGKDRGKVSMWTRPFEPTARRLEKAQVIFGEEMRRRHDDSNRRRRDGWLLEGPANIADSGRKALNQLRKGMPFKILPKL